MCLENQPKWASIANDQYRLPGERVVLLSTWALDTLIGSLNTTHVTLSESGGVVKEPRYDQ